jgi:hypothetical protein
MFNTHMGDNESLLDAMIHKPSHFFNVSEHTKFLLYDNSLVKDTPKEVNPAVFRKNQISYRMNRKNYRSPDFHKDTDILFAGCSLTYGDGIPEEFVWPSIVARDLNLTYANLGLSGDSVYGQVKRIFAYFKEFGHPKYLYAVFPDFYRMVIPINRKVFTTGNSIRELKERKDNDYNEFILKNAFIPGTIDKNFKMSIRPHVAEHVLNPEIPHFLSAQSILMLDTYCEAVGIKFAWSTWDQKQFMVLKSLGENYYKNLIDIDMESWEICYSPIEDKYKKNGEQIFCHNELKDISRGFFDLGMDRDYGIKSAHWGSHRHQHVADIIKSHVLKWINNG